MYSFIWREGGSETLPLQIGSSIQIFLFVLPFLVCLSWGLDKNLTLSFDVFETVVGMCIMPGLARLAYPRFQ